MGFSVLAIIFKHGLKPNAHTLSTLLHGLSIKASMFAAMELFQKIVKGYPCNDFTYATISNGFCEASET